MKNKVLFWQRRLKANQPFICALRHIKGIGADVGQLLITYYGFSKFQRLSSLNETSRKDLTATFFDQILLARRLDRARRISTTKLFKIGLNRAKRRVMRLPVRGQRTHSNAETARRLLRLTFILYKNSPGFLY